jgi:hypothetical protein
MNFPANRALTEDSAVTVSLIKTKPSAKALLIEFVAPPAASAFISFFVLLGIFRLSSHLSPPLLVIFIFFSLSLSALRLHKQASFLRVIYLGLSFILSSVLFPSVPSPISFFL